MNKIKYSIDHAGLAALNGQLAKAEPMSRHTSWRTGGKADYYYRATSLEDLKNLLSILPDAMPITWIGRGSNLLVRDGGICGIVISTTGAFKSATLKQNNCIEFGSAISCVKAANFAAESGLAGIEFLAGIPGTIGGALAMNAGAHNEEIWSYVKYVKLINRQGILRSMDRSHFHIGYRNVNLDPDQWFTSVILQLQQGEKINIKNKISALLRKRSDKQPVAQLSCGSVFKNPDNAKAAAYWIESAGLKGFKIGAACVSEKHANFIINMSGKASSSDIERLIHFIQHEVLSQHHVELIPEVKIIGMSTQMAEHNK